MLNKKYNEQDVRQLFSSQGSIEECTVLRDQNGQSKGCAFVTYATKQSAISAIKVSESNSCVYSRIRKVSLKSFCPMYEHFVYSFAYFHFRQFKLCCPITF